MSADKIAHIGMKALFLVHFCWYHAAVRFSEAISRSIDMRNVSQSGASIIAKVLTSRITLKKCEAVDTE